MALTQKQINALNNSMKAAQDVGLGTIIADIVGSGSGYSALTARQYDLHPSAPSATAIMAATALTSGAQAGVTAGITQPDYPRVLTAKGNASGNAGDVVIHGTNFNDETISDTIALNGSTEVAGVKAFKTVTSVDFPAETHAGTDTVSIGQADKYGFPIAIPNASLVLAKTFNGAVDAGTTTAAATVEGSFYDPAGSVDGAKVLSLVFLA